MSKIWVDSIPPFFYEILSLVITEFSRNSGKLCTNRRQHMTQEITLRQQVSIEKWTGIIKDQKESGVLSNIFRKNMNPDVIKINLEHSRHHSHINASYPCISWSPIVCQLHGEVWRRPASRRFLHLEKYQ